MTILLKEFKEKVKSLLNSHSDALIDQSELYITNINSDSATELAIEVFERTHTLNELNILIDNDTDDNQEVNSYNLKPFKDFLSQRWEVIKNTELSYVDSPQKPLSKFCFYLAKELLPFHLEAEGNVYDLLMPTITVKEDLYGEVKDLSLGEFVLSDDLTRTITILDSLSSAIEDGILKHTTLIDGKPNLLVSEKERVINHSLLANKFFNAIESKIQHQKRNIDKDLYSSLIQLIRDLRGGSVLEEGEEYNAGAKANEGILRFHHFLETLDESEKEFLMNLSAPGLSSNFGDLWGRLCRPKDADYENTIYCVELSAGNIESIVEKNKKILCKDTTEQELQTAKKEAEEGYEKSNLIHLNINKKLTETSLTTIVENIFLQQKPEQIQKTFFQTDVAGVIGIKFAIHHIKNPAIWQWLLTHLEQDQLAEALLLKDDEGFSVFQYMTQHIQDPEIWRVVLHHLNQEKLMEALLLKNNDGVTGFQYTAAFIQDPTIWKELLPNLNQDQLSEALFLKDNSGTTGFQYAIQFIQNPDIWRQLLPNFNRDKLANALLLEDNYGVTNFQHAIDYIQDPAIWKALLPRLNPDKLAKALLLQDSSGGTGFQYATRFIKDPDIWKELLHHLSPDKLAEALLLPDNNDVTGFQHAALFIKDPDIWKELLSSLNQDKLLEIILLKDNNGLTGIKYAAAFIHDLEVWRKLSPASLHIVNSIDIDEVWSNEIQNEIKAWKNYILNPEDSITSNHSEAYLQFLEGAIPNNQLLITHHDQWLSQLAKSLSCTIDEDKKEKLNQLYIRVFLAKNNNISVNNPKEEKESVDPEKLPTAEQEILLKHINDIKKIDYFSANESFQIANLLAKNSSDKTIISLHLQNAEIKGHPEASLMLKKLKNIYINDAECLLLQEIRSYINNLISVTPTQFFLSKDNISLLKELVANLDKVDSSQEREKLISNYMKNIFLINKHPKLIEILNKIKKNYDDNEPEYIRLKTR